MPPYIEMMCSKESPLISGSRFVESFYWPILLLKKTIEKTSPRLLPVALGTVVCAHSRLRTALSEYLWYPRNLNLRDVDRRADISHLKSGRRSVL